MNPLFLHYAERHHLDCERLLPQIVHEGHLRHASVPESARRLFVTALEVPPSQQCDPDACRL